MTLEQIPKIFSGGGKIWDASEDAAITTVFGLLSCSLFFSAAAATTMVAATTQFATTTVAVTNPFD